MCLNINKQWYCSAAIQFWFGRDLEEGGDVDKIQDDWFYDPKRWGIMSTHQPERGETVGIFVAAGNLRDNGNVIVRERSNVVLLPFGIELPAQVGGARAVFISLWRQCGEMFAGRGRRWLRAKGPPTPFCGHLPATAPRGTAVPFSSALTGPRKRH